MGQNQKGNPNDFTQFLQSMVKLDALEKMTVDLDEELADSQRILKEIKSMFDSIPKAQDSRVDAESNGLRHEDLSKFLEAGVPKLLLPDMSESTVEVDIDNVIATMKGYAEDLKKKFVLTQPQPQTHSQDQLKEFGSLELEQYATSLDQLSKRLANIKLNKTDEANNRNADLEAKLSQLCQDVDMFTQMVQSKTTLSESNQNWMATQHNSNALCYDNIINKLLSGINEVTYLLQNKN